MNKFEVIIKMLDFAFTNVISEDDYYDIVDCITDYEKHSLSKEDEAVVLNKYGWVVDNHPSLHKTRLRYGMVFGLQSHPKIKDLVHLYRSYSE
jgi:hypothetical protein